MSFITIKAGTYGSKYTLEYSCNNGQQTRIVIYEKDYSGGETVLRGTGNPLTYKYDLPDDDYLEPLKPTTIYVKFYSETNFQFFEFYTNDARRFLVTVEKKAIGSGTWTNFWIGFVLPEQYKEPYLSPPYPLSLAVSDGLGFLKNIDFTLTGTYDLFTIINDILDELKLDLEVYSAVDIYEDNHDNNPIVDDPLKQTFYNCDNFYNDDGSPLKCDVVLMRALEPFGLQVKQFENHWLIMRPNMQRAEYIRREYTSTGEWMGYATINNRKELTAASDSFVNRCVWLEQRQVLEVNRAYKEFTVKNDYGIKNNTIFGGNFTEYDMSGFGTGFEVRGWTRTFLVRWLPMFRYDLGKDVCLSIAGNLGEPAYDEYIESDGVYIEGTTQKLNITFKHGSIVRYKGDYRNSTGVDLYYRVSMPGYTLKKESNDEYVWDSGDNKLKFEAIQTNSLQSVTILTDSVPVAGNFQVRIYPPDLNLPRSDYTGNGLFESVKLNLVDSNDNQYPETAETNFVGDGNSQYKPSDIELFLGDLPDLENAKIQYAGGLLLSDGSPTTNWTVLNTSTTGLLRDILGQDIIDMHRRPQIKLTGKLDSIIDITSIIVEPNLDDMLFFINSATLDDEMNEWVVELIQLIEPSVEYPPDYILREDYEPVLQEDGASFYLREEQP